MATVRTNYDIEKGWVESERDYTVYRDIQASAETRGDYSEGTMVTINVFVDDETGIIVQDVEAFEKWIEKIEGGNRG